MRILVLIWRTPGCRIPNNDAWIAHKMDREPAIFRPIIGEFCKSTGNFITQKRLLKEWNWVKNKSKSNSAAAKARWEKEKLPSERNANAMPLHLHPDLHQQDRKIVSFRLNGGGRKGVEMTDGNKLAIFHNWLAPLLGNEGWSIIGRAMDPQDTDYSKAVTLCRMTAKKNGKGWPHQWPK